MKMRQEQILGALLVELATFPYLLHHSYLVVLKIPLLCGLQQCLLLGVHITFLSVVTVQEI